MTLKTANFFHLSRHSSHHPAERDNECYFDEGHGSIRRNGDRSVYNSPVGNFFKDINQCKLLESDEERELFSRLAVGDIVARRRLIEANLRLVPHVLQNKGYFDSGLAIHDRIQEGTLALIKAVERYEPERGVRFASYAGPNIDFHLRRTACDQIGTIHVPVPVVESIRRLYKIRGKLEQESGRSLTDGEFINALASGEVLDKEAARLLLETENMNFVSIDTPEDQTDPESCPEDYLEDLYQPSEDDLIRGIDYNGKTESLMDCLSDREQVVIRARYYEELMLEEIAQEIGITRQGVQQIESRALAKLQKRSKQTVFGKVNSVAVLGAEKNEEEVTTEICSRKLTRKGLMTRVRILRTALGLAREFGIENLTFSAVAREMGMAPQNVNRYFESKTSFRDEIERSMQASSSVQAEEDASPLPSRIRKRGPTRRGLDTRRHILDAGVKLARESGIENLTLSAIVHEIGMSRTSVIRIFHKKYHLLKAVEAEMLEPD